MIDLLCKQQQSSTPLRVVSFCCPSAIFVQWTAALPDSRLGEACYNFGNRSRLWKKDWGILQYC